MRYDIEIAGRRRQVQVTRRNGSFAVEVDGRSWSVDAVRVDAQMLSLLMRAQTSPAGSDGHPGPAGGVSQEIALATQPGTSNLVVRVQGLPVEVNPNARARRGGGDGAPGGGPQRLVAPMPGKVVRVLIKPGDLVTARQPLVVVEAMKMENELRAARDGRVTDVTARDGQSVEAGTLLAVISDQADAGHAAQRQD